MSTRSILVISANWRTRALLATQLGHMQDRDVISAPDVNAALGLIKIAGIDPASLVVDTDQQMSPENVDRLMVAQPTIRPVLIVSALRRAAFDPLRDRCAAYLIRPVSIGRIAQVTLQTLEESPPKQRS